MDELNQNHQPEEGRQEGATYQNTAGYTYQNPNP